MVLRNIENVKHDVSEVILMNQAEQELVHQSEVKLSQFGFQFRLEKVPRIRFR